MSLEIKLEDEDRKFVSGVKTWWADAKKQAMWMAVALVFGFGLGKVYTWDAIATDCRVLGMFRIAYTPFHCKMMTP